MSEAIGSAWRRVRDRLAAGGVANPGLDARLLAQKALGMDATGLIAREKEAMPEAAAAALALLAERRLSGEPVARILGRKEFYGLAFDLDAETLVPRPETEMLVDFGIAFLRSRPGGRLLDLGTGSGCVGVAILHHLPGAHGVGVDISPQAVARAAANAEALGVGARFSARVGDWFAPLADGERFDCIVSNPPYIETGAIERLAAEVRAFDPRAALDGGKDGLSAYRRIVGEAREHLAADGAVAFEIGKDQGRAVARLLEEAGFANVGVETDLSGHDRLVSGVLR